MGFKAPDAEWKKMKKVYDSCKEAGIDPPSSVDVYFNYSGPDERGVVVDVEETEAVKEYSDDGVSGFEVDLSKLPKDLTHIRFYNSW